MSKYRELKTVELTGTGFVDGRRVELREDIEELHIKNWEAGTENQVVFVFSGKYSDDNTELWCPKK